tara:strand:+ start:111 stop:533 length:423 start_codon:yes stop_codon:yes gene_type:complete
VNPNLADFRPSYRTKVNAGVYAVMVFQLIEGATVQDIVDESGLSPATVRKYVNAMYNAQALRIIRWDMNTAGRRNVAVYKLEIRSSSNKNAKRPTLTPSERQARYKARKRGAKAQALDTIWKAQASKNEDLTLRPPERSL